MKKPAKQINYEGEERRVGLEIEYSGLSLERTADIIHELFGGNIIRITDAVFEVKDTELGDFTLELDAIPIQKAVENADKVKSELEESILSEFTVKVGEVVGKIGAKVAPFEIVSPPIIYSKLPKMEALRKKLLEAGVIDTNENLYAAFGLHINPEVVSLEANYILHHIQSFLLLSPWLIKQHDIDVSRKVTSFIDPFPKAYFELVLNDKYAPGMEHLIRDYHQHNPTRNRALDMLPLFAYVDELLVRELYGKKEKINKRPTFHYRLPNSEIANKEWSFNTEWKRWLSVEEVAHDKKKLGQLLGLWQEHNKHWLSFKHMWIKEVEKVVKGK